MRTAMASVVSAAVLATVASGFHPDLLQNMAYVKQKTLLATHGTDGLSDPLRQAQIQASFETARLTGSDQMTSDIISRIESWDWNSTNWTKVEQEIIEELQEIAEYIDDIEEYIEEWIKDHADEPRPSCIGLGIESEQCFEACNKYFDELYLVTHLNQTNNALILSQRMMSSTTFAYDYAGINDMCKLVRGRFCATPLATDNFYVYIAHGCCIPRECHGSDAQKVTEATTFCYTAYNAYMSALLGADMSNLSNPTGAAIPIQCEVPKRNWGRTGVVLMFVWIGFFAFFITVTTIYRLYQYDEASGVYGPIAAENNAKSQGSSKAYTALLDDTDHDHSQPSRVSMSDFRNGDVEVVSFSNFVFGYYPINPSVKDGDKKRKSELAAINKSIVKEDESFWNIFVNTFCIQESYRALISTRPATINEYPFLDGMRFWSMTWVVLGHSLLFYLSMFPNNWATLGPWLGVGPDALEFSGIYDINKFYFNWTTQAFFSVDTFFWMSGFLATKSLLKLYPKFGINKAYIFVPLAWVVRWLRFVPMLFFIMCCQWAFLDLWPNGPFLLRRDYWSYHCEKDAPKILFFYGNLLSSGFTWCMTHTWYLDNDIQMFLCVPIVVIAYAYRKQVGLALTMSLWVMCVCIRLGMSYYNKYLYTYYLINPDIDTGGNVSTKMYPKPWTRCGPYFAGVGLCLILDWMHSLDNSTPPNKHGCPSNVQTSRLRNLVLSRPAYWCIMGLGSALLLTLFLAPYDDVVSAPEKRWNVNQNELFNGFGRPVWGVALSLMAFAMRFSEPMDGALKSLGHSSLVKTLISGEVYQVLGKLTFTTYLIHYVLFYWFISDLEQSYHYTVWNNFAIWMAIWIAASALSFCCWFLMERPLTSMVTLFLTKVLMPAPPKKKEVTETTNSSNGYDDKSTNNNDLNGVADRETPIYSAYEAPPAKDTLGSSEAEMSDLDGNSTIQAAKSVIDQSRS